MIRVILRTADEYSYYPGTASLRDTSSEGSVSSRSSSSGSTEGRSTKILAGSGLEKGKVDGTKLDEHANSGVEVANLVGTQGNANSGSEFLVWIRRLVRRGDQPCDQLDTPSQPRGSKHQSFRLI